MINTEYLDYTQVDFLQVYYTEQWCRQKHGGWMGKAEIGDQILVWDHNNLVMQVMTWSQASEPNASRCKHQTFAHNVMQSILAIEYLSRHQAGYLLKGWI